MQLKERTKVFVEIFSNSKYVFIFLLVALVFVILNGAALNIRNAPISFGTFGPVKGSFFFIFLSMQAYKTIEFGQAVALLFLSALLGVFASALFYRYDFLKEMKSTKDGIIGSIGFLFGAAAPGCAGCGVGLISLLGFYSALAVLPFNGKEVVFAAIALVCVAIYRISGKIYNASCGINYTQQMKGGKNERNNNDKKR